MKKILLCFLGFIVFCIAFYVFFPKYQIVHIWRINRITGEIVDADNEADRTEAIISARENEREHMEWVKERKRQGLPEELTQEEIEKATKGMVSPYSAPSGELTPAPAD